MERWLSLRVVAGLAQDPDSVPNTHIVSQSPVTPAPGPLTSPVPCRHWPHTAHTFIHALTHTDTINHSIFLYVCNRILNRFFK